MIILYLPMFFLCFLFFKFSGVVYAPFLNIILMLQLKRKKILQVTTVSSVHASKI